MNNVLLEIRDLGVHFFVDEGNIKAVDGIDLVIRRGETVALVGESGCGKSVTALSIMQLVPPPGRIVKGQIIFNGQNIVKLAEKQMRRIRGNEISMVFQEPMTSLNPVLRIRDHMTEVIRLHEKVSKHEAIERSVEMLRKVGIPDPERRIYEYPHQMSGGMRQRIMIAMALACRPKLVIADEPTTALDVTIQAQILDLMNTLQEDFGASLLLITHDLGVVAEMARSVAVMYAGQIVEYADIIRLFLEPKHPYTLGLMRCIPKLDEPIPGDRMLQTIPGVVPSPLDLPRGCYFQERCFLASDHCRSDNPPLFEVGPGHLARCWHHGQL
jgi:peptide/nickel transport system ATP-binding protein